VLTVACIALAAAACGGPPAEAHAWCADNIDEVHKVFVENVYGQAQPTVDAMNTELGQRMAAYFASPDARPPDMTENEQRLVDSACQEAYGAR
jgi:hypothetical protein